MNADNRTYDTSLSNTPTCWIPPEREGEYHSSSTITAYREPMAGWEPLYRANTAQAAQVGQRKRAQLPGGDHRG